MKSDLSDLLNEPERCGAAYPLDPSITCVLFGKCPIDAHIGVLYHPVGKYSELVIWGRALNDLVFPRPFYRILPLEPAPDERNQETRAP